MNRSLNQMHGVKDMSLFRKSILAMMALTFGACAGDVVDIDRTQPDRVEKSLLVGEWYFLPTIIEADANQAMVFEGAAGTMERVRWEIREKELIAYRSYALLINAEDGNGEVDFNGSPVAIFPITSHFDVKRDYNPATGEQSNVIVENTTDRPWYERDYIRVDWAQNLIGNPYRMESTISAYAAGGFYERGHEPNNPHRPEISAKNINVVGQYFLYLDAWYCTYYWDPIACQLGDSSAKLKLSFMKIEGDRYTDDDQANVLRDYETLYYPDVVPIRYSDGTPVTECYDDGTCLRDTLPVFERFGYFRNERIAYDDEFGWTRDGRLFVGHRWNIWDKTYDNDGQLIPAEWRPTGKVIYYTNVRFPEDGETDWTPWQDGQPILTAWDASQKIASEWDFAFRQTVAGIKQVVNDDITADDIDTIFELRRNDCNPDNVTRFAEQRGLGGVFSDNGISSLNASNLERACALLEWHTGGEFTWQKFGDLRYSFFNWVDKPQLAGPLGYGPSSADPVTGEIIQANANVYGTALDTYASYAADVVSLMNGELDVGDLINGTNVRDNIRTSQARWNREMSPDAMQREREQMFGDRHEFFGGRVPQANGAFFDRKMMRGRKLSADEIDDARALPVETSKLDAIIGTDIERELLINDDLKRAMLGPKRYQPGQALTGELADFSPISFMLGEDAQLRREAQARLGTHAIDMMSIEDFDDVGMVHLADELEGLSWAEVYNFMRLQMYRSVMAHEVGHTLGLRHNFQGSFDPLNYAPEFWESYNPATGKVEKTTAGGDPTKAERLMYSSIMDYDARFYADSLEGIGPYDRAAIKFGYGLLVEVFDSTKPAVQYLSFLDLHDYHAFPKVFTGNLACNSAISCAADLTTAYTHYDDYAALDAQAAQARADGDMTLWGQLHQQSLQAYERFNSYLISYLRDSLDGVSASSCTEANDYCNMWSRRDVRFTELQNQWTNYYEYFNCETEECQEQYEFSLADEVPYKFCPDEISMYGSWVECLPYDKGATYHEVTVDRMVRYDSYYVFTNFKRDRAEYEFNDYYYVNQYLGRLYDRFFAQQANVYRNYLYSFSSMGRDKDGQQVSLADFPLGRDWQAAGLDGLNFLNSVVEQPEPGTYCLDTAANTYRPLAATDTCASGETMDVGLGVGKHYNTKWTNEYLYKATVLGTFWDKYAALFAMTDNEGFFYRDYSSLFDIGAFQLSYWSSNNLRDKMLQLFRGAFDGGTGEFAWRFDPAATGNDQFVAAPVIDVYSATEAEAQALLDLPKIESASSYTLQWYGVVLPMARYNSGFDYAADFVNYARICLDGYVDCQTYDTAIAEYVDPLTGYRYIASRTDKPEFAIAPKILDDAQQFVADVYTPAKQAYDDAVANGDPEPTIALLRAELQQAEHRIAERTAFIDTIRDFSTFFGGAWR